MAIRRARLREWRAVFRVVQAAFGGEPVDPFDTVMALLMPWVVVLVAEDAGHLVGTTMVMPAVWGGVAWISTVGVAPAYRRRGVARALMEAAEQHTRRRRLQLDVYADNDAALALYVGMGYREIHRRYDPYVRRMRVEMEKRR